MNRALPKVELHCHLDGIVDLAIVRELRHRGWPLCLETETLEAAYPIRSIDDFMRWGRTIAPTEGDLELFKPILALHLERLKAQHVVYAELMIAPSEIPRDPSEAVDKVRAFRASIAEQEQGVIRVELIACCNRRRPEAMANLAGTILRLYEEGLVVGVALAGLEPGHPVKPLERIFARFHEAGMGIEIHAGEWCGPESVWDALAHGYPTRIGHGVSAFQDPRLIETLRERGIHIEMCPTSNLKTGSIASIADHPIARARKLGLSIGVNTDDPGAFGCSMESEYALLAEAFGFGPADFAYLYDCALAARFGGDPPLLWQHHETGG